jgi:hypothetical protein
LSGATPNATQLIEELRWALEENRKENATLTAERDEARQMICRLHFTSAELQHDFAKAKGWDCFKEDGK